MDWIFFLRIDCKSEQFLETVEGPWFKQERKNGFENETCDHRLNLQNWIFSSGIKQENEIKKNHVGDWKPNVSHEMCACVKSCLVFLWCCRKAHNILNKTFRYNNHWEKVFAGRIF